MQQSLLPRPIDGTKSKCATEDFLNAIKDNMVMTVGPEQTDSPYHEAWILKRMNRIQTSLIGPAQQWYSDLLVETRKNWQGFCRECQKKSDYQQLQPRAKLLLESIARASGEH